MADYKAQGYSGLKGRPATRGDVDKMTDKERRRKKLERVVGENKKRLKEGKGARTISEHEADKVVDKFRSTEQKIRRLQGRVADMRGRAVDVERSGTGNVKAAATYRQVAKELKKRISALRGKK